MIDQLINQVAERTGLSPDKARTAVDTVVGFLKDKLPGPVASQLDNAISGEEVGAGASSGLADAARGAAGAFNRDK